VGGVVEVLGIVITLACFAFAFALIWALERV
jgi:hypothetical protein